jgi:dihydroceramide fatty acyl 2-hydroxylase
MGLLDLTPEFVEAVERWSGHVGPPSTQNRKKEAIRVFQSSFVENYLATSHPALPGLWFGWLIAYGAYVGVSQHGGLGVGLFALGVLMWTLLEYTLHRWLFHAVPPDEFNAKVRQFMLHGYHHEFPNDPWRLVAPPLMSFPIAAVVAAFDYLVFGAGLWLPVFAGTVGGYLAYDWLHYYEHHFNPRGGVGKYLKRIHALHHFANSERNHGISSPLWDFLFRTYQGKNNEGGRT